MIIFLEKTFKCHKGKSFTNLSNILNSIDLPCLTNEQKRLSWIELGEKSMSKNKTSGNDQLRKDFYENFWSEMKDLLLKFFYHAKT